MSERDLPELPSDEELGITEEDIREYEESVEQPPSPPPPSGPPPKPKPAPPSGGVPQGRPWRGPLTLLLLLVLGWATLPERVLPDTADPAAPDTLFSSGRAMLDMVDVAREPHPPGSPEHTRVREMLLDRLVDIGLAPEVQTTTSLRRFGDRVEAATVRNVLARVPGSASTGAVLLTAHYDGRGIARAAGDDGAGVVTILETLRAVMAGAPLRNDLIVLLTDAEELGLLGARAFVEEHPWLEDVAVVLSVEMRGGGGPSIMFETGTENGWIVGAYGSGSPRPFANSLSVDIYRRMPNDTDFSPFRDLGVQGLNFAGIGNAHVYHQRWDEPERFDERTLQHHGVQVLGMVRELGVRDLSNVDAPDRAYFTLPLVGLVSYPTPVGYGLGLVLLVGFAGVFVLLRRGGVGVGGVVAGLLLAVVAGAVTAGAAHLLFLWTRTIHPEYGSLHGSAFHVESWYVAAVVALGAAATVLLLALARRRFGLGPLALGAAVPAVLGALFLTFASPLGSHTLQWPALLAVIGAALVAGVAPGRRPGLLTWLGLLVVGAGIVALAVPLTEFVWLALSFEAAAVIGVLVAVWLVLALPLLDVLREPGRGWAPILGVVAAAVFVGVGALHSRPSPERPAPSTLVYVADRDSALTLWGTRAGSGGDWAAARVGTLDVTRYWDELLLAGGPWRTGPAPAGDMALPEVSVAWGPADGPVGPGRSVVPGTGGAASAPVRDTAAADTMVRDMAAGETVGRDTAAGDTGVRDTAAGETVAEGTAVGDAVAREPETDGSGAGGPQTGPSSPGRPPARAPRAAGPPGEGRRTVTVAVRSVIGAERMVVRLPESADVHLRAVNGRDVPDEDPEDRSGARRPRTVSHWGTPVADDGLHLVLDVGPGVEEVTVEVIEHHLRPGELVGERWFLRPPSMAPDVTTGSDRAVIRTPVRIYQRSDVGAPGG